MTGIRSLSFFSYVIKKKTVSFLRALCRVTLQPIPRLELKHRLYKYTKPSTYKATQTRIVVSGSRDKDNKSFLEHVVLL